jgi:hypothetical protein
MICVDDDWDADLEAGVCVIVDDVPMGTSAEQTAQHICLWYWRSNSSRATLAERARCCILVVVGRVPAP